MTDSFRYLITRFYRCAALNEGEAPHKIVDIIRRVDGRFLLLSGRDLNPDPLAYLTPEVNITMFVVEHPSLARDPTVVTDRPLGSARLLCDKRENSVTVSQNIPASEDTEDIERLAHGQLAFAQLLWPHLHPCYGYVDEDGRNVPTSKDVATITVKCLLWANFFGEPYVEALGRAFLLNAPGWKTEPLTDGGILYLLSSRFTQRDHEASVSDIEVYMRKRVPRVRLYQPKPLPEY